MCFCCSSSADDVCHKATDIAALGHRYTGTCVRVMCGSVVAGLRAHMARGPYSVAAEPVDARACLCECAYSVDAIGRFKHTSTQVHAQDTRKKSRAIVE